MPIERCTPEAAIHRADFSSESVLFKALGDPARLTILATLARNAEDVCVCDFTSGLAFAQSTVSHHLKLLKECGLVVGVRRGTWVYYSLAPGARERIESAMALVLPFPVPV